MIPIAHKPYFCITATIVVISIIPICIVSVAAFCCLPDRYLPIKFWHSFSIFQMVLKTTNTQNIDQIRRQPSDSRSTNVFSISDTRVPNIHFSERIINFIGPFNFLKAILLNKLTKIASSSLAVLHLILFINFVIHNYSIMYSSSLFQLHIEL